MKSPSMKKQPTPKEISWVLAVLQQDYTPAQHPLRHSRERLPLFSITLTTILADLIIGSHDKSTPPKTSARVRSVSTMRYNDAATSTYGRRLRVWLTFAEDNIHKAVRGMHHSSEYSLHHNRQRNMNNRMKQLNSCSLITHGVITYFHGTLEQLLCFGLSTP